MTTARAMGRPVQGTGVIQAETETPDRYPPVFRRILAGAVDLAFLWLITEILAAIYEQEFIALGRNGRLIGALFFLAYVGGQNSTFTNGRTLGKRLCGLRVVTSSGAALSLERSLARAALLLLPFLTRGVFVFPAQPAIALVLHVFLVVASVGYGVLLLASYLSTRRTGQALHDRFLGTFVVRDSATDCVSLAPTAMPRWSLAAGAAWLSSCAALGAVQWWVWGGQRWNQVIALREAVAAVEGVARAEVFLGTYYFRNSGGTKTHAHYLEVLAVFPEPTPDLPALGVSVARAVVATPLGRQADAIRVTVGYEFDLLLARHRWQQSWVRTPQDWQELVSQTNMESRTFRPTYTRP
ncbi:MAG: hypothetical protein KatS3mg077_0479 [Candidatus Binatia bacterium]|nr:MAG: hypothetical protein KatS3mg077_0479 [Candidatus Binatia bacterium]